MQDRFTTYLGLSHVFILRRARRVAVALRVNFPSSSRVLRGLEGFGRSREFLMLSGSFSSSRFLSGAGGGRFCSGGRSKGLKVPEGPHQALLRHLGFHGSGLFPATEARPLCAAWSVKGSPPAGPAPCPLIAFVLQAVAKLPNFSPLITYGSSDFRLKDSLAKKVVVHMSTFGLNQVEKLCDHDPSKSLWLWVTRLPGQGPEIGIAGVQILGL